MRPTQLRWIPFFSVLVLACASPDPPAPVTEPQHVRGFQADRAYDDVRNLVAIGPRDSGTEGAARARDYLRGELEKSGIEVNEIVLDRPEAAPAGDEVAAEAAAEAETSQDAEPSPDAEPLQEGDAPAANGIVHVQGVIPGTDRSDIVVLAAVYDTRPEAEFTNVAANGSASGPALVLELARAIAAKPLPYSTWVMFLDGDEGGADSGKRLGSRLWVLSLREDGDLDRVRVGMFFRQVCDPDLRFERDLFSHRVYRESLWRAARRQGATDAFAPGAGFATPPAAHLSMLEGGMRRVVAVVDDSFGGTEPPGALAGTAEDTLDQCSAESLGTTGRVTLEALDDLTAMLVKVDRLSPEPAQPEEAEAAEEPEAGSEPNAEPSEAAGDPPPQEAAPEAAPPAEVEAGE
jgi:hypothetical protein